MQLNKEALNEATEKFYSKYLSATLALKYPDSFICFYCVQSAYSSSTNWCYGTKLEETLQDRLVALKTFCKPELKEVFQHNYNNSKVLFTRNVIIM